MSRYEPALDGEWFEVPRKDFKRMCCDCHLVHREEHKVVDGKVMTRVWRDDKATKAARKRYGIEVKNVQGA